MRLLVVTQAIDRDDRALGFFVRWIEELATRFERIEVICLKSGRSDLPKNVRVHSLGKESTKHEARSTKNRIIYTIRFLRLIWRLRHDYDAVFVHMNQEYVLLGGWFWRLLGKKAVLWRNHKMGSWLTRLAAALSNSVCYTSPDAFVARYKNAVLMPVGIDTDFFTPPASPAPADSILFLGRLDPVKKAEKFVEALAGVPASFHADIYGSPTEAGSVYARRIAEEARPLVEKGMLAMHPGVPYERTRDLYRSHAVYVNLTPSGSFDKTIGEAAAAGCIIVCANRAMQKALAPALLARDNDRKDITRGITAALRLAPHERATEARKLRAYIEENHSLKKLIGALEHVL